MRLQIEPTKSTFENKRVTCSEKEATQWTVYQIFDTRSIVVADFYTKQGAEFYVQARQKSNGTD